MNRWMSAIDIRPPHPHLRFTSVGLLGYKSAAARSFFRVRQKIKRLPVYDSISAATKDNCDMVRIACLLGMIGWLTAAAMPVSATMTPKERIADLNAALLDVMQNADALGYAGRYERLQPVMTRLYDFSLMARIAVGAYWAGLEEANRNRLVDAFSRMSIATYAARFDGYSGERFEIVSAEKAVRDTTLVKTRLIKSDGTPVALNYLTRPRDGEWRIIDVFLDARFSELARLRADYTAVINRQGFENLIETIEAKIKAMESE